MRIPSRIRLAAQRLREGRRVNRLTVRDFLHHFGAERRGAVKVSEIRQILDKLSLETVPDFETAWIDGPISLRIKAGAPLLEPALPSQDGAETDQVLGDLDENVFDSSVATCEQIDEQLEPILEPAEPEDVSGSNDRFPLTDPTFRIGSLPAAHAKLIAVNQDDFIAKAITLMLQYDFSQLPIMQGEREAKGVVTWKSIASREFLGSRPTYVRDCREDAHVVGSNSTLFGAIPIIVQYGYVLVRSDQDQKITGIVTSSDLSVQFAALAEPFLLLREIELHVRKLLHNKVNAGDLELLTTPATPMKAPEHISDLTFGQYVRLFERPEVWAKLELEIDVGVLTELLEKVRLIRNDVMHFDPDPMTQEQLTVLKRAVRFMQDLYELLP